MAEPVVPPWAPQPEPEKKHDGGYFAKVPIGMYQCGLSPSAIVLYGWLSAWDTRGVANGTYTLQSVATFPGGATVTSPGLTMTVSNPPPNSTIVVPSNGATISGVPGFDALAFPGVSTVHFVLTGGTLNQAVIATATPTLFGWLARWDSTTVPNGTYTLQSVASYAGGVTGTSPSITITVSN